MKVLFICSGNSSSFKITPFIERQAHSLERKGVKVSFFLIEGKGISGYLKHVKKLKEHLEENDYDLLHAHYTFNALVALLTFSRIPIVVSYMGSDTYGEYHQNGKWKWSSFINILISLLIQPFVDKIIVKSPNLEAYIFRKQKMHIIPNGVDLESFREIDKLEAKRKLKLSSSKKVVLFLGNPHSPRKNLKLLTDALQQVRGNNIDLITPYPVDPKEIPDYLNCAEVLALTSFNEGSPNVIKEAMACNIPIVTTPVGDVDWLLEGVKGGYIAGFDAKEFAKGLGSALQFAQEKGRTDGRKRIIELGLDWRNVADRILKVYEEVLFPERVLIS